MGLEVSSIFHVESCLILEPPHPETGGKLAGWEAMGAMSLVTEVGTFLGSLILALEVFSMFQVESCLISDPPHPETGWVAMGAMGLVTGVGTLLRSWLVGSEVSSMFQAESCLTLDPPHPSCDKSASLTEFNCSRLLDSLSTKRKFRKNYYSPCKYFYHY